MDAETPTGRAIRLIQEEARAPLLAEIEWLRADHTALLRAIIDHTWGYALEDRSVPSTNIQDQILAAVIVRRAFEQNANGGTDAKA